MSEELANLLAMLPEGKYATFASRLPPEAAAAIANGGADIDAATLSVIADAVWSCLEE